jgi:hypothetical protein
MCAMCACPWADVRKRSGDVIKNKKHSPRRGSTLRRRRPPPPLTEARAGRHHAPRVTPVQHSKRYNDPESKAVGAGRYGGRKEGQATPHVTSSTKEKESGKEREKKGIGDLGEEKRKKGRQKGGGPLFEVGEEDGVVPLRNKERGAAAA